MQTIALARLSPGSFVTANDIHQPFLDDVEERAKKAGVKNRIATLRASIDDLPFRA
ncbi:MAG TPA: class I SAM-dependent methyltransferase [Methanoregulaceae archaeon]|nr:class I SAM-dependent methyltransferase [Methanoregulaceae archaeon]HPD11316.1 class I SAM-dependent methyltransferase [Methanoregulaceae archaeon]HRT16192.1 class I SAM-dependent methyltransferase [Methanoregulaceae archaeon]HRU31751.1 class I SAM-dependent methyltransferase [Methanoregulaceae archaeon]